MSWILSLWHGKKDITITYANDILTIGAQHKEETEEKSPETSAQAASASSDTAKRAARLQQKKNIISSVKNVPIRYTAVSSTSVTSSAMASKLRLETVSSPSRYPNRILMPFRPAMD